MAKYDPVVRFLVRRRVVEELLSFTEIERLIGGLLPKSAQHPEWWRDGRKQAPPWRLAGYDAELVGPELVRFSRRVVADRSAG